MEYLDSSHLIKNVLEKKPMTSDMDWRTSDEIWEWKRKFGEMPFPRSCPFPQEIKIDLYPFVVELDEEEESATMEVSRIDDLIDYLQHVKSEL